MCGKEIVSIFTVKLKAKLNLNLQLEYSNRTKLINFMFR